MRVLQIILPGASRFESKSQRLDAAALVAAGHEVVTQESPASPAKADVAHVYGSGLSRAAFARFPLPYIASEPLPAGTFWSRKARAPRHVTSPVEAPDRIVVPEAVEEIWFLEARLQRSASPVFTVGSFVADRRGITDLIDRTLARIHRFRDDIRWKRFSTPPSPEEVRGLDAWIDPALSDSDYDGYVAEAIAAGLPVVAARTPLNTARLEQGRTGFLTPVNDPNELTHAILAALFKPEVAQQKLQSAQQTVSKFRVRQRLRVLTRLYQELNS